MELHLVCHSHLEAGWQMTTNEYYALKASRIFTSVVKALQWHPKRRFSLTEVFYFQKWWLQ